MKRLLDLRFVIGLFFLIIGLLLLLYYLFTDRAIVDASTVNLWCGAGFLGFGAFMLALSFFGRVND